MKQILELMLLIFSNFRLMSYPKIAIRSVLIVNQSNGSKTTAKMKPQQIIAQ